MREQYRKRGKRIVHEDIFVRGLAYHNIHTPRLNESVQSDRQSNDPELKLL